MSKFMTVNVREFDASKLTYDSGNLLYDGKLPILTFDNEDSYMLDSFQGIRSERKYNRDKADYEVSTSHHCLACTIDNDTCTEHESLIIKVLDTIADKVGAVAPYKVSKRGYTYSTFKLTSSHGRVITPFYHVKEGQMRPSSLIGKRISVMQEVLLTAFEYEGVRYIGMRALCVYYKELGHTPDKPLMKKLASSFALCV